MAKTIPTVIQAYRNDFHQLLFTGHSAGGAVAALLFSHFKLTGTLGETPRYLISIHNII
jgi:putative lipase involved disintegration of autophagic bodies